MNLIQRKAMDESIIPSGKQGDTQAMFFDMKSLPKI